MTSLPPAGWYPAPHANGEQRYWDGQRWTEPSAPSSGPLAPRGWAIAALVLGIVAFLLGLIPWLGLLLSIAAVGAGVVALVRRQSKPPSIIGTVLGAVALLTSLVVTIAFVAVLSSPRTNPTTQLEKETDVEASVSPTPSPAAASATPDGAVSPTPDASVAPSPAPLPAEPVADGSVSHPLPQPYTARGLFGGEKYSLTARIVNADAGQQVSDWNRFNDPAPAGFKYVVIEYTMTGIDPDGVEPSLADADLYLATSEGNRYSHEFVVLGDDMPRMSDGPTLYPGNAFTGYAAYVVPASAQSFLINDNGKYVAF